jgi:CRP/FNR family cyclic AMP-dependent transcriptional regulator
MTLAHILRNHAFTRGLTDAQIGRLALLATEVTFEENEVSLVHEQRSQFFYLVVSGSVAVELRTPHFTVCVQALGPDQIFGWSSLLDLQDTLFQVRARERTTALRLDGAGLVEAFHTDTELAAEFLRRTLKVVAGRVEATEVKFAEMCGVPV